MSNRSIKIFVGNLPFETNDDELRALVHGCGNPRHVVIKREQHTGRSRGYGYVEYKTEAECVEAIKFLAGKEIKGRTIKVDFWDDYYRDKYADLLMSIAYPKGEAGGSKPAPGKKHEHMGQSANQAMTQGVGFGSQAMAHTSQALGQASHAGDVFPPLAGQPEHFPPGVVHTGPVQPLEGMGTLKPLQQPQFPGVGMEQLYQQPLPFGMPLVPPGVMPLAQPNLGLGQSGLGMGQQPVGMGKPGAVLPQPPGLAQPPMGLGLGQPGSLLSGVPVGHAAGMAQPRAHAMDALGAAGPAPFVNQPTGFSATAPGGAGGFSAAQAPGFGTQPPPLAQSGFPVAQPVSSPLLHPLGQLSSFMGHPSGAPVGGQQFGQMPPQSAAPAQPVGMGATTTGTPAAATSGFDPQVGSSSVAAGFGAQAALAHALDSSHTLSQQHPLLAGQPLLPAGLGAQPLAHSHAFGAAVAQPSGFPAAQPAGHSDAKRLRPEEPLLPESQLHRPHDLGGASTHPLAREGQPGQQLLLDNGRVVNNELFSLIKKMSMQDVSKLVKRIDALMEKSPNTARSVLNSSPAMRSSLMHAKLLLGYKGLSDSSSDPKTTSQFSSVDSSSIFDYFVIH